MAPRITKMMLVWFATLTLFAVTACGGDGREGNAASRSLSPVPGESFIESPQPEMPSVSPTPSSPTPRSPTPTSAPKEPAPPETALTVIVIDGPGAQPRTWELTCDPAGGSHPDPAAACAAIIAASERGDPFAPVPADAICTQIYGGPQEATVKGTWEGAGVGASFSRENGCEIARWDALLAVFQTPIAPRRD